MSDTQAAAPTTPAPKERTMKMNPPSLPLNYVPAVSADELVLALELIEHATAPTPDDGGHHEAAHDLASGILAKVRARRAYEATK